ncbi:unnamed protein product [Rhizophagus irregularis]|nr:unnamed protein product [Rhizophagus irregularis]
MSKLNRDILFLIFEEFLNDSRSLFSCLIVNRLWCETAIPILWRNPWRYEISYNNESLFYDIVSYLTDDIKEFLTEQGIKLPSTSHKSFLFDYLSYCGSINISIINTIISRSTKIITSYTQFLLQQEIYKVLIKKCLELKCLDIISIKHQIFYFPEANTRLNLLCELTCSTSIDPSYFYGLSRICQKIQRLIIINTIPKANHGIVKLIEVQKNLKYFEWEDDFDEIFFIDPYEDIFMALTKRADTLNHLKVIFQFIDDYEHTFLQKVLPELHNLRTLKIDDLTLSNESSLKKLFYRDLEIFKIDYIEIQTATCIVENSGGYLRKILLKYCSYDNFNEDSLVLIRTIYKNCPLIEDLSLVFSSSVDHFIEFEKLLLTCKQLKSLLLIKNSIVDDNDQMSNEDKFSDGEELLKILVRSAPNNLREIRFFDNFKISLEILGSFLEGWRGRPSLSILTSDPVYEGENYINLVKKYKDDGVIKDFRREI